MPILDIRGYEVLDTTPVEIPLASFHRPLSMFERMQHQLLLMKKEQEDVIVDEADLQEDLNDFSWENETGLFSENTPYTVPDDVSDVVRASEIREAAKKQAEQKTGTTEVKNVSSDVTE